MFSYVVYAVYDVYVVCRLLCDMCVFLCYCLVFVGVPACLLVGVFVRLRACLFCVVVLLFGVVAGCVVLFDVVVACWWL